MEKALIDPDDGFALSQETLIMGGPAGQEPRAQVQDDSQVQDSPMPDAEAPDMFGNQVQNIDRQVQNIEQAPLEDDDAHEVIIKNLRDMLFVMQGWKFEGKYMQEAGQKCDSLLLQASTLLSQFEFEMAGNKGFNRADAEKHYEEISNDFASIKRFYMLATDDVIGTPERTKPSC